MMILPLTVVLYPVFFRYQSPVQRISIAEAATLIVILGLLVLKRMKIKINIALLPFWGYLLLRTVSPLGTADIWDSVGTGLRLVFLYFTVAYITPQFNYEKGVLYLNIIAVIISVYGLLQILLYSRYGLLINTELPFLTPYREAFLEMQYLQETGKELRIRSLFGEPADLCSYLLLPITINLFMNKKDKGWMQLSLLYSLVCIISKSSTGIIMVSFLWFVYFIKIARQRNKSMIIVLIALSIGAAGIMTSGIWRYFIERTFGGGLSGSTRFGSISEMFSASGTLSGVLFGQGMSELGIFLPGFARLYLYLGLIGILTFAVYFLRIYKEAEEEQKYVWLVFLVLNIGTPVLLGCFALPYLVFMYAENTVRNRLC